MISMGTALNRDGQMEGAWFGDIGFAIRNSESFSKALPMGIGSLKPRGDMVASRKVVHWESATDALCWLGGRDLAVHQKRHPVPPEKRHSMFCLPLQLLVQWLRPRACLSHG